MTKKRRIVQPEAKHLPGSETKKTLAEVLAWAGIKEYELLNLIPEESLMRKQIQIVKNSVNKIRKELAQEHEALRKEIIRTGVDQIKLRVEIKKLQVDEAGYDEFLTAKDEAERKLKIDAVALVFDMLHIQDENSGEKQLINSYLKTQFPAVMKEFGMDVGKPENEIIVPETKIILP